MTVSGNVAQQTDSLLSRGLNGVLTATNRVSDFMTDNLVEPAVQAGGDILKDSLVPAIGGIFGVSDKTIAGVQSGISDATSIYKASSDLQQEYAAASIDGISHLASKYLILGGTDALVGGPETGLDHDATTGKLKGFGGGIGAFQFATKYLSRLTENMTEATVKTTGGDMGAFQQFKGRVDHNVNAVNGTLDTVSSTIGSATREAFPDQGDGGDPNVKEQGWLTTGLGWLHSGLQLGTKGATHALGYAADGIATADNWLGDGAQWLGNKTVDGLQALGIGPSEATQDALNSNYDATQDAMLKAGKTQATWLHNLANPLSDTVADGALELGAGFLQGGLDLGQRLWNIAIDTGQVAGQTYNKVQRDHGKDAPSLAVENTILANQDKDQAYHNHLMDTMQLALDKSVATVNAR